MLPVDPLLRARVRGVRVSTNVSTPIVACLTAVGMIAGLEPGATPFATVLTGAAIVLAAMLGAIGLTAIAQVLVFSSKGIPVRRIHLLLFGCIIQHGNTAPTPRGESLIGIAGMVALLVVPGSSALLLAPRNLDAENNVIPTAMAITLGGIVVLQLLPGLGLNGGRLLGSLVWYLTDSAIAGARVAALYAFVIGGALTVTGLMSIGLSGPRPYLGLWALVAGWQLSDAARLAVAQVRWHTAASTKTLADILQPTSRIEATAPIDRAIDLLAAAGSDAHLLVMGPNSVPVGILRRENLRAVRRSEWHALSVGAIATPLSSLPHVAEDDRVLDAVDALDTSNAQIVVVISRAVPGQPIGTITRADLTRRGND